jgi:hypothetical protein
MFSVTLSVPPGFRRAAPRILRGMLPGSVRTFLCAGRNPRSDHLTAQHPEDRPAWWNDEGKVKRDREGQISSPSSSSGTRATPTRITNTEEG